MFKIKMLFVLASFLIMGGINAMKKIENEVEKVNLVYENVVTDHKEYSEYDATNNLYSEDEMTFNKHKKKSTIQENFFNIFKKTKQLVFNAGWFKMFCVTACILFISRKTNHIINRAL